MQRSLNKALAKCWQLLSRQLCFFYDGAWWWNLDWYPYWIRDNGDLCVQDDAKLDFKYHFQPKIDKKLEYTYSGAMLISGALKQISSAIFRDLLN